jgi:hypothetical protein
VTEAAWGLLVQQEAGLGHFPDIVLGHLLVVEGSVGLDLGQFRGLQPLGQVRGGYFQGLVFLGFGLEAALVSLDFHMEQLGPSGQV